MKISLQFEPIIIDDGKGNVIFEANIFDLSLLIGGTISKAIQVERMDRTDNRGLFQRVADEINSAYKCEPPITWGMASALSKEVDEAIRELKKNGKLSDSPQSVSGVKKEPSPSGS